MKKDVITETIELLTANISAINNNATLITETVVLHEKYLKDIHVGIANMAQSILIVVQALKKAQSDIKELQQKPYSPFISDN